jgi:hypothetical protein
MVDTQGFLVPEVPSSEPTPEVAPEQTKEAPISAEVAAESVSAPVEAAPVEVQEQPVRVPVVAPVAPVAKDELQNEIEGIMSKDLTDVFLNLPDNKKEAFKIAGEQAAIKIMAMIQEGKVKVKKILDIIRDWLRIIPGVNKFFLEQETKIKADAILNLVAEREKSGQIH